MVRCSFGRCLQKARRLDGLDFQGALGTSRSPEKASQVPSSDTFGVLRGPSAALGDEYLSSVERLNGDWEMLASMGLRREGAACAVLWEKLYVCGGNDGAVTLKQVERYDPEVAISINF